MCEVRGTRAVIGQRRDDTSPLIFADGLQHNSWQTNRLTHSCDCEARCAEKRRAYHSTPQVIAMASDPGEKDRQEGTKTTKTTSEEQAGSQRPVQRDEVPEVCLSSSAPLLSNLHTNDSSPAQPPAAAVTPVTTAAGAAVAAAAPTAPSGVAVAAAASAESSERGEESSMEAATTRKRQRRVGVVPANKQLKAPPRPAAEPADSEGTGGESSRTLSKHDERWNAMFAKLLEYKRQNNSTQVPQCYDQDARLGRWVHYQRGEFVVECAVR
jgi:Helicase associated domain